MLRHLSTVGHRTLDAFWRMVELAAGPILRTRLARDACPRADAEGQVLRWHQLVDLQQGDEAVEISATLPGTTGASRS